MVEIFFAGGPVMYPLLLCSVISLAVIFDRTFFWLRYRNGRRPELITQLYSYAKNGQQIAPDDINPDLIARVLLEGLISTRDEASWRMQQAGAKEASKVTRNLGVLNTMVSLAPLLGIFGTVLGIIESFQLLGDASLIDPIAASGGLAQALITTAFGLGIAMPSLIAYKVFQSKAEKLRFELEAHATELELSLGLNPVM
jgi:biopolymer transport protein ExbB